MSICISAAIWSSTWNSKGMGCREALLGSFGEPDFRMFFLMLGSTRLKYAVGFIAFTFLSRETLVVVVLKW